MKTSRVRSSKRRPYKKVYYIVTEGKTTEPSYFNTEPSYFKIVGSYMPEEAQIAISCQAADRSSIDSILQKAKSLASSKSQEKDEVWVTVDQDSDSHLAHQFAQLQNWERKSPKSHIAVSAPRFEYWLLCHFEDSPTKSNAMHDAYLAQYLPGYDRKKDLDRHRGRITLPSIRHAIEVASRYPLSSYDSTKPGSDVWKLVHNLITDQ